MTTLFIILAILFIIAPFATLALLMRTAPYGYEDDCGFHYDSHQTTTLEAVVPPTNSRTE